MDGVVSLCFCLVLGGYVACIDCPSPSATEGFGVGHPDGHGNGGCMEESLGFTFPVIFVIIV